MPVSDEAQALANDVVDSAQKLANHVVDAGEEAAAAALGALADAIRILGEAVQKASDTLVK